MLGLKFSLFFKSFSIVILKLKAQLMNVGQVAAIAVAYGFPQAYCECALCNVYITT